MKIEINPLSDNYSSVDIEHFGYAINSIANCKSKDDFQEAARTINSIPFCILEVHRYSDHLTVCETSTNKIVIRVDFV